MTPNRPAWPILAAILALTPACSLGLFNDPPQTDTADNAGDGDADTPDAEADIPPNCGNGETDPGEQCDDGNHEPDDGCEPDCTWSCSVDPECRDTDICNGAETCDTASHVCIPGENLPNGTDCTRPSGDPGQCRSGACRSLTCGNGTVDTAEGEQCDDGDDDDSDRCPTTCLWATCGDGFTWDSESGDEECDDGNDLDEDGCDTDCTWSCSESRHCDDNEPCNGVETCDTAAHRCAPGTTLPDGERCTTGMGQPGACQAGICIPEGCGDGTWSPPDEGCDDGDHEPDDGCEPDCRPTCSSDPDCRESPDDPCTNDTCAAADATTGARTCNHHPNTGGACDDGVACTENDRCDADGHCHGSTVDADHDGHAMAPCGGDCNDSVPAIHPGLPDNTCDGIDDNCDTRTDEDFRSGSTCDGPDADLCLDGTLVCTSGSVTCTDDSTSSVEVCNGVDDNCDTATDEDIWCLWASIPGTSYNDVWIDRSTDIGFAVGFTYTSPGHPTIARWNPSAPGVWTTMFTDALVNNEALHGVWGFGSSDAWTVGTTGLAYRYAGTSWDPNAYPIPWRGRATTMYGLWGASSSACWTVGAGGTAFAWNGSVWDAHPGAATAALNNNLNGVCGLRSDAVWAVGVTNTTHAATIVRWDGFNWSRESTPTSTMGIELNDCWAVDGSNIYAVGAGGTILHSNGDGTWTSLPSGSTQTLWGVWGTPDTPTFAVGAGGTILRRTPLGWRTESTGSSAHVQAIHGRGGSSAFAVVVDTSGNFYRWHP